MIEAPALEFTIRHDGGAEQKLVVDSDHARLGSGAHCQVRLPAQDAASDQVHLWARAGGVFGEARCLEPPAWLHGSPFVRGRLLPESVLCIGRVSVRVELVSRHRDGGAPSPSRRAGRRLLYALGGVGIPLGILCAGPRPDAHAPEWNLEPQRLWPSEPAIECPPQPRGSHVALADQLRQQGEAARERAPFSPRDGVQAVESLARAAACYAAAGAEDRAEQMQAARDQLELELERQFHVHQVRLERALDARQYDQAKRETRILLSFTARRGGPYYDWLSTLERQIDVGFSRSES